MPRAKALMILVILGLATVAAVIISQASPHVENQFQPSDWSGSLIINHTCIDLDAIPVEYIEAAQANIQVHYAHTSHGGQITTGLGRIESSNDTFNVDIGSGTLPTTEDALCILDGNPPHSYITPELYWEREDGVNITQDTLDNNPSINVSLWSWCTQLNSYTTTQVQSYLDTITALEAANPDVIFVYMTCNAQAGDSGGYNRWVNNNMIRDYCITNNKVLFDFADLDCWSDGNYSTYEYTRSY